MRITGGILCGRKVKVPGGNIRPAMDRMRESVFAILGDLTGLSFLDLFSGSGIIALEAASRGAMDIEAVEADPLKRKTLLANVNISPQRINCRFMSVELYIIRAKRAFDLIFCDPSFPYRHKSALIQSIADSALVNLVNNETRLLIHYPKNESLEIQSQNLILQDTREFGLSAVSFFTSKK